ncbi:MAG: 3-oxoacyl-ACP reductase FabG [Planctomycetes bacterium]|nr:3-oxoacyl-ACP reductase FabG [Planctomycetota bacterium]
MSEQNKEIALVTGASRGIGKAVAIALAQSGRHVVINYRSNEEEAQKTLETIESSGGSGELCPFDVSDGKQSQEAIGSLLERYEQIHILVNNAGIRDDMLMIWMEEDNWNKVLDTNLSSFYHVSRPILKNMLSKRFGRIINMTSTSGQSGMPGQVNYSAAKSGLIGATMALAKEVAKRKVTVNAVAPGFIESDMLEGMDEKQMLSQIPMKRLGKAEEVAGTVVFLCSESAAYITGQVIAINGGIYT